MTIAEVAEKYSLTPDTLRYYERIGLLPRSAELPAVSVILRSRIVTG